VAKQVEVATEGMLLVGIHGTTITDGVASGQALGLLLVDMDQGLHELLFTLDTEVPFEQETEPGKQWQKAGKPPCPAPSPRNDFQRAACQEYTQAEQGDLIQTAVDFCKSDFEGLRRGARNRFDDPCCKFTMKAGNWGNGWRNDFGAGPKSKSPSFRWGIRLLSLVVGYNN
jgi:hypothetical protein